MPVSEAFALISVRLARVGRRFAVGRRFTLVGAALAFISDPIPLVGLLSAPIIAASQDLNALAGPQRMHRCPALDRRPARTLIAGGNSEHPRTTAANGRAHTADVDEHRIVGLGPRPSASMSAHHASQHAQPGPRFLTQETNVLRQLLGTV